MAGNLLTRILRLAVAMAAAASLAQAQVEEPEPAGPAATFSSLVDVRVINVDVTVTDRAGRPVDGLGVDDFELRVDGEPVSISNFYAETRGATVAVPAPASDAADPATAPAAAEAPGGAARRTYVVILVDHTRLQPSNRKRAFEALRQAIDELAEGDPIAVVGVEGGLVFYSDFLLDRRSVATLLDRISTVSRQSDVDRFERRQVFGELARGQSGGLLGRTSTADAEALMARIRAYAAQEYDRSLRSMQQIESVISTLAGAPGRKLLLYVGEGIPTRPGEGMYVEWRNRFGADNTIAEIGLRRTDFNSDYTREVGRFDLEPAMDQLATAANRAGVVLYAVDAESSHGADIRSALTEQGATSETLSVVDENFRAPLEHTTQATGGRLLRSSGKLAEQLAEMAAGLGTFYSLGFAPPNDWQPGSDHAVRVEVAGRGLVARYRETVRLHAPDEREASATLSALMYKTLDNPLGVSAVAGERSSPQGDSAVLPIDLALPARRLGFVPRDGKQNASISIYVASRDAAGNPRPVQKIPFHLAIPDQFMEQALGDSARYILPFVVRRGDQQVAIGVHDEVSGLFSALRLDLGDHSLF